MHMLYMCRNDVIVTLGAGFSWFAGCFNMTLWDDGFERMNILARTQMKRSRQRGN